MLMINTLAGVFIAITLLVFFIFKSTFACLLTGGIAFFALFAVRADVRNKIRQLSTILNLIWLMLCEIIALMLKFIYNIDVFQKYGDRTLHFTMIGVFVLCLPGVIRVFMPERKSH